MSSTRRVLKVASLFLLAFMLFLQGCSGGGGGGGVSVVPPTISSVTPNQGTIGTIVTIDGSNFQQSGVVTFTPAAGGAGVPAVVTAVTATTVDVQVPAISATPGGAFEITVTNPDGGAASTNNAFTVASPVVTDINGGLSGSGAANSLFIIDGNNFGDLSTAPTSTLYPYSVDFRDASTNNIVASASVNFTNNDWQNIFIVGTVPNALTALTTYKVTVTTPTGTSAPMDFLILGSVSFSPSSILWSATSALPAAQQGFPTVISSITTTTGTSSYIYTLGGNISTGSTDSKGLNTNSVYMNVLSNATGSLVNTNWTSATALPDKRGFAAAVDADGFNSLVGGNGAIYVLGGLDGNGNATSTAYYTSLNADGTIPSAATSGTWTTTTPLPQALYAESAVIFHGKIYVAGGNDATGNPVANVYAAKINSDGTLGAWQALPDLPSALAYHQLVTSAGYLYVLGGDSTPVDPITRTASSSSQGNVYYNQINIRTGSLASTTWTTNSATMGKNREKFTATVAGSYILVSGGLYSGASTGSSEQSYAAINTDGSIGSFNGATGAHTISGSPGGYNFFNHSSTYFVDANGNPHVLILGGEDVGNGSLHTGVWLQH